MAFDCRIKFTGLCAFVPNKPLDQSPDKMCVVLVDGTQADATPIQAIDGTILRRHRAFLVFDLKNLPGFPPQRPKEGKGVWYLEQQRLTLDLGGGGQAFSTTFDATIDATPDLTGPSPGQENSFSWVANMVKIAPTHAKMNASSVTTTPPAEVIAQVILDQGTLATSQMEKIRFCFPNTLGPDILRKPLAHEVTLTLTAIPKLIVNATPLAAGGVPVSLELQQAAAGEPIEIEIVNLCEENPLRWPKVSPIPQDDEDFRWYYQLLDAAEQGRVKTEIRGLSLPIPFKEKARILPAVTGVNCFPVRFGDLSF
jgi:hypothetical protein